MDGTGQVLTSADFNAVLGRADVNVVQVRVLSAEGTSPTLTVNYDHSNNNKDWDTKSVLVNAASVSAGFNSMNSTGDGLGAFGRLSITLGGTDPSAWVQIIVAGRSL